MINEKPLTASQLADALGHFEYAARTAMQNGRHNIVCITQGIDAVMRRLQQIARDNKYGDIDEQAI
jgi:hypothetical protein